MKTELSRWQKMNIVHGFLNAQSDDVRLHWNHSIDRTYQDMRDGHHGTLDYDGNSYHLTLWNGVVYHWSEH